MKSSIIGCAIVVVGLFAGSACKKSSTDKAETEMRKEQEKVGKLEERSAEDQSKLSQAQQDEAQTRARFLADAKTRIGTIDTRIEALAAKADRKSQDHAMHLRKQRDELVRKLDAMATETPAEGAQRPEADREIQDAFDQLERDMRDAPAGSN